MKTDRTGSKTDDTRDWGKLMKGEIVETVEKRTQCIYVR